MQGEQNRGSALGQTLAESSARQIPALLVIYGTRTVLNAPFRIVYPFLPSIARGLGVSLGLASGLVTLRVLFNLLAPLFGPFTDRYGRRVTMEIGLLICGLASVALAGLGTVVGAALAFALFGIAKAMYDPAAHAYVADSVPYERRGRAAGLVELSWSTAWLVGVPLSGLLIERWGWRSPWAALAVLSMAGTLLMHCKLPDDQRSTESRDARAVLPSLLTTWATVIRRSKVRGLLAVAFFLTLAVETPLIVYGAWLETSFGLGLATLGLASTVVGVAELAGEFGTAVIADRLGKRRSVLLGMAGLVVSLVLLPVVASGGLLPAMLAVVCVLFAFEFSFVSFLPVVSEAVPHSRATLLALNVVAFSLGRVAGTSLGGWLWRWQSISIHCGVGAVFAGLGALMLWRVAIKPA